MEEARYTDHVRQCFAAYPSFKHNENAPVWDEIYRLRKQLGKLNLNEGKKGAGGKASGRKRADANTSISRNSYASMLVLEFNERLGTNASNLHKWQNIDPIPNSNNQCKKAIAKIHVNLYDLLDYARMNKDCAKINEDAEIKPAAKSKKLKKFKTVAALSAYSYGTRKIFPKNNAKAGDMLKHLLRLLSAGN